MFDSLSCFHVNNLMYPDFFLLKNRDKGEIKTIQERWLKALLHCDISIPVNKNSEYLFLRTLVRSDYQNLFHCIANECSFTKNLVEDFLNSSEKFNIEASNYFSENIKLQHFFKEYEKDYIVPLTIRFIYYCFVVRKLLELNIKTLVCFADMQPIEYLASICFKRKGCKTVTLQHGLYIEYNNIDTVNKVNYINQPSDYFLAWGENTKQLIEKHHNENKVVVCGKPNIDKCKHITSSKSLLVIFDQEIFHNQNVEMYRIVSSVANDLGCDLYVKFHPLNNIPAYEKKLGILNESTTYPTHKAIIGHTSSLIYELQASGLPVLQYKSEIPNVDLNSDAQFYDIKSFGSAIDICRFPDTELSSVTIKFIADESKRRYRDFFDRINCTAIRPFFTIIIPSYNSAMSISRSIDSLKKQSFKDFEVLIMDGSSTDATIPIALSAISDDKRFLIYSSPDRGTYDAMNKGIEKSKGRWIYFMGSDDSFNDEKVLEDINNVLMKKSNYNLGMVYGNVEVKGDVKWAKDGTIYDGPFDDKKIKKQNICHQSIFYNRKKKIDFFPYNLKYKLCADWDMNLKFWAKTEKLYINRTIAKFYAGGQSTNGADPEFGKDFKNNIEEYFRLK